MARIAKSGISRAAVPQERAPAPPPVVRAARVAPGRAVMVRGVILTGGAVVCASELSADDYAALLAHGELVES